MENLTQNEKELILQKVKWEWAANPLIKFLNGCERNGIQFIAEMPKDCENFTHYIEHLVPTFFSHFGMMTFGNKEFSKFYHCAPYYNGNWESFDQYRSGEHWHSKEIFVNRNILSDCKIIFFNFNINNQ